MQFLVKNLEIDKTRHYLLHKHYGYEILEERGQNKYFNQYQS